MTTLPLSILDTLIAWDTRLSLAINAMHCDYADSLMEMLSGKWVWMPFYLLLFTAIIRGFRLRGAIICVLLVLALFAIDDQLCSSVIRSYFERMRPSNPNNPISPMVHIVDGYRGGRFGFPSAHATNTWGAAFFMAYLFRHRWHSITMALWALIISYSRIYLGVHYLGDVMAGMLLGLFNATVVYLLFRYFAPQLCETYRTSGPIRQLLLLPIAGFAAEVASMCVLAFFIDPIHGI